MGIFNKNTEETPIEDLSIQPLEDFKVGDWMYHNFELYQAVAPEYERDEDEEDDGEYSDLSDGYIRTYGRFKGEVYPVTMRAKLISETFKRYDEKIRKLSRSLNFPDIHRTLVNIWHTTMQCKTDEELKEQYDRLQSFYEIIQKNVSGPEVEGIKIFR